MVRSAALLAAAFVVAAATPALAASAAAAARASAPRFEEDAALTAAVADPARSDAHKARDAFRHPYESLTFWGLTPGMTVIEIQPGGEAWWTEILAPYAKATGGTYLGAYNDLASPNMTDAGRKARADFEAKFGVKAVNFGSVSGVGVQPSSADMVLVARAFHNWAQQGSTDQFMAAFFKALKPGGVLAVEQHRAPEGSDPMAGNGYVPESYVIEAAKKAGFVLEARSDLNANPKDTRDHPFGVWTLPPVRRTAEDGRTLTDAERAHFDAIGESDRMTLRFRKPA
ncbi:class I SAM-dependent methyltransferase [Caulobacter sp. 17J80-11]|uniref:class I SAM-dependent methyltransferase n=1 Tax=Caulobacter sp. 17J80-11 TaxID=2763502 RepID=UPI001653AA5F|nr:class I SAM-dependent methyltransferase [Caulobacter sp. 17J80-11]MBC6982407.1 class I SAM-dependent methyltransferase [Caulobacter sp. 17J80-11]